MQEQAGNEGCDEQRTEGRYATYTGSAAGRSAVPAQAMCAIPFPRGEIRLEIPEICAVGYQQQKLDMI